jgi:hypothetical protein
LARLLATAFRRWAWALIAEPETLNILNSDMMIALLVAQLIGYLLATYWQTYCP